eukprot:395386-Pleurochrysis_carterae.AAC.1
MLWGGVLPTGGNSSGRKHRKSCYVTGRILCDGFLLAPEEERVLIDVEAATLPLLEQHLRRFKLRSKVNIADRSAELAVLSSAGSHPRSSLRMVEAAEPSLSLIGDSWASTWFICEPVLRSNFLALFFSCSVRGSLLAILALYFPLQTLFLVCAPIVDWSPCEYLFHALLPPLYLSPRSLHINPTIRSFNNQSLTP